VCSSLRANLCMFDCGFTERLVCYCYRLDCGLRSPGELLSLFQFRVLVSFVKFPPEATVLSLLGTARIHSIYYLCVSGDGVGCWGVSCITAISRPDGSFVCGFLVLKFLLL
jgi:hypothetical protein